MSGEKRNLLSASTGIRIDIITHARWFVQHPNQARYQTSLSPDIKLKGILNVVSYVVKGKWRGKLRTNFEIKRGIYQTKQDLMN